jgi:hypothetical protein
VNQIFHLSFGNESNLMMHQFDESAFLNIPAAQTPCNVNCSGNKELNHVSSSFQIQMSDNQKVYEKQQKGSLNKRIMC